MVTSSLSDVAGVGDVALDRDAEAGGVPGDGQAIGDGWQYAPLADLIGSSSPSKGGDLGMIAILVTDMLFWTEASGSSPDYRHGLGRDPADRRGDSGAAPACSANAYLMLDTERQAGSGWWGAGAVGVALARAIQSQATGCRSSASLRPTRCSSAASWRGSRWWGAGRKSGPARCPAKVGTVLVPTPTVSPRACALVADLPRLAGLKDSEWSLVFAMLTATVHRSARANVDIHDLLCREPSVRLDGEVDPVDLIRGRVVLVTPARLGVSDRRFADQALAFRPSNDWSFSTIMRNGPRLFLERELARSSLAPAPGPRDRRAGEPYHRRSPGPYPVPERLSAGDHRVFHAAATSMCLR